MYVTPMTALSNMTWREFINSEYTNQNSMFTNFSLYYTGSYESIEFYHEEAMQNMYIHADNSFNNLVKATDVIEEGKTYAAV